jgi:hypothetical protein
VENSRRATAGGAVDVCGMSALPQHLCYWHEKCTYHGEEVFSTQCSICEADCRSFLGYCLVLDRVASDVGEYVRDFLIMRPGLMYWDP